MQTLIGDPEDWWNPDDWVYPEEDPDRTDNAIKQIKELRWEDDLRRNEGADPDDAA